MASNLVRLVRNLQQRKGRKRRGLAVAEGLRLVEEALEAGVGFQGALVSRSLAASPRGLALLSDLAAHAVPVEEVEDSTLVELADSDTPQGVVAVIDPPRAELAAIVLSRGFPALVVDGVQDPGNVGALLRTAFALGAPGAILLKGTADPANPKVLRAGMGASFRLPVAWVDESEFANWVRAERVTVWVTDAAGTPLDRLSPVERLAVVVGNEAVGVRPSVAALAHHRVAIPLARGAESLNVAVAAGIVLHEVRRVS